MIEVRRAREDAEIEVARNLFREYAATLPIDLGYQGFEAELAALPGKYAPPIGEILLAMHPEGKALGCVALRPFAGDVCEMKRLYVRDVARGQGVGRQLATAILAEAATMGYGRIVLDTLATMTPAISLYRELGFAEIEAYYDTPIEGTVFFGRDLRKSPLEPTR